MMRSLLVFALLLVALPAMAADPTLGISMDWDPERTKREFARAGVKELPQRHISQILSISYGQPIAVYHFNHLVSLLKNPHHPAIECQTYENGIERRDFISFVAVCFWDRKYQVLVMPFFRKDGISSDTLYAYLNDKYLDSYEYNLERYGKEEADSSKSIVQPEKMREYIRRRFGDELADTIELVDWVSDTGLFVDRKIYLLRMEEVGQRIEGVELSAAIAYLNNLPASRYISAEQAAEKEAAEKEKEMIRKGL